MNDVAIGYDTGYRVCAYSKAGALSGIAAMTDRSSKKPLPFLVLKRI